MKLLLAALFLTACGQFDGSDGQNGSSCTTRNDSVGVFVECSDGTDSFIPFPKNGGDGTTGPQGEKGDVGQTGEAGTDGVNGTNGVDGAAGADGRDAQVVSVQLCPGDTGAYKEQGFLIDNNLYAVYFDYNQKQTFLAELKTGSYKTTNGSNCQFTYVKTATQVILSNGSGTTTIELQ